MAPRARGRPRAASQSGGQAPAPIDSLPDALVGEILLHVPFQERRSLARVCRRWRQLVDSPALLRGVSVRLAAVDKFNYSYEWDEDRSDSEDPGWHDMDLYADALYADPEMPVRHIFDFCGWLQRRAAPHVQQLTVRLGELNLLGEPELSCDQSVTSALRRAIKACTRLQHLLLSMQCSLRLCPSDDLAPAAQAQLRSLFVTCLSTVADPERQACLQVGGLLALTALESLHLAGNKLLLGNLPSTGRTRMGPPLPPQQQQQQQPQPADGLPPSLTSLALDGFVDVTSSVRQFVPAQLAALTNLRRLTLGNLPLVPSGASFSSLTALSRLTGLQLLRCAHLPTCLPRLPQLHALRLNDSPRGVAEGLHPAPGGPAAVELGSALQQLVAAAAAGQQLRHLVLENVRKLPAEVAALPHLETLCWAGQWACQLACSGPAPQLPASGPYLSSLRRLALAAGVAAGNTAVLATMPRLEALVLQCQAAFKTSAEGSDEASVLAWAAQRRPSSLRRLALAFEQYGWDSAKYKQQLEAHLAGLELPPSLTVELNDALLRELQAC